MRYITGTREFNIEEPTVVTLGKFDGLHRGHQKLLNEVFRFRDKGYKTAVFTFETAPGTLMKGKLQTMITTNAERRETWRKQESIISLNILLTRKWPICSRRNLFPIYCAAR